MGHLRRPVPLLLGLAAVLAMLAAGGAAARSGPAGGDGSELVEVVVTLPQPSLSQAILSDRGLAAHATTRHRLNVRATASVSYLRTLASAQRTLQARIESSIPDAQVRWRYGVVLNGMAVVVPRSKLSVLASLPGATVWPSVTYHSLAQPLAAADRGAGDLGADARDRRQRHEDRDHRRRDRPDAPVLRPDGLRLPGRLPEGEHRVHDAEGDRRARVRSRERDVEVRHDAVRPAVLRTTRRTSPGSPPATTGRSRAAPAGRSRSPGSRRRRISATTRSSPFRRGTTASTATRPRSPPGSSRR